MHFMSLVDVLARRRRGAVLLRGLAAALAGVERLMRPAAGRRAAAGVEKVPAAAATRKPRVRTNYFSIKRTQSELGYTYWVLHGHGAYASYALFDTWTEAMAAAEARLLQASLAVLV